MLSCVRCSVRACASVATKRGSFLKMALVLFLLPSICRAQQQQYCIDQVVGCFDDQGSTRQLPHAIARSNHRQSQSLCASACHSFCKYSAYPTVSLRTVGGDALTCIDAAANHNHRQHITSIISQPR